MHVHNITCNQLINKIWSKPKKRPKSKRLCLMFIFFYDRITPKNSWYSKNTFWGCADTIFMKASYFFQPLNLAFSKPIPRRSMPFIDVTATALSATFLSRPREFGRSEAYGGWMMSPKSPRFPRGLEGSGGLGAMGDLSEFFETRYPDFPRIGRSPRIPLATKDRESCTVSFAETRFCVYWEWLLCTACYWTCTTLQCTCSPMMMSNVDVERVAAGKYRKGK